MLRYYEKLISKSSNFKNLTIYIGGETLYITASNQVWSNKTTQSELRALGIYMQSCGVLPVMLIERSGLNPLVLIGEEDDGTIFFKNERCRTFDLYWARHLINDLEDAISHADKHQKISYQRKFVTNRGTASD